MMKSLSIDGLNGMSVNGLVLDRQAINGLSELSKTSNFLFYFIYGLDDLSIYLDGHAILYKKTRI